MEQIRIKKWSKRKLQKSVFQFKERKKEKVKYDFDFITEEKKFLPVPRALITALENPDAALYLMRLIELQNYWCGIKKRGRTFKGKPGWFYTSNDNMMAILSIKKTRLYNAKKLVKDKGLIETHQHNKEYFWVNRKAVKELIQNTVPAGEYGFRKIKYNNYG